MSSSESDSDSSGWTLLSREGLDEECVGAKQRCRLGHSDSEEDGAETVPARVARSQGNGFLEGKLREALEAGGEGCERVGETGLPDEATCMVERPPGPEEVKEDVNADVGDEDKEEVRDEEDEMNKTNEKLGKASEPMGEEVERVDENVGNVTEKVKLGEELSVEVSEKMMEEEEVSEVVSEVLSGSMSKKMNKEVKEEGSENMGKEVKEEGSENMGKEVRGEISKAVSEKVRGEVSEELSGDVQAKVIEVSEKMEEVKMERSEVVMEEVRGEVCKDMMEEMGEEMMEVSEEVSGSDDSDLFTLDPSALDEIPDPFAPSEASVEMPDSAAGLEDPPHLPSSHSEASVEPVTRADGEDTLAGSLSIGGRFPFPLGRERAPSGAGSSTDEEDQEKLIRCDDDEIGSGPMAPRLRRRLARRQLPTALADSTVPATGGTMPGTGVPVTVLVPALALALIVALGLVIASNHVASERQGALVQQNERLRATERQLQAEATAMAGRWEAERGSLSQENAALRAALIQLRQEVGRSTAAVKQEAPGTTTVKQEAPGAVTAQGQEVARAAARELAAEGRRLQAEVRRLHRELREERAASATTRGERDAAAVALEAERQRSHLWERLYVEARDAAAEHGKRKKEVQEVRGPDPRHRPYEDAKNSTRKRGERGAGQAESDASRGRGWGGHATSGAGSEASAEARQGDGRRGQGQGQGQGSRRRGEERLKMKGRDWRGPEEYGAQRALPTRGQGHNTKHNEQHNRCHEQHKQQSYRAWHGKSRRHCDLHVAEVEIELGPLPFGPKY
ncbi:uncharacterized protein LOC116953637 isoform X2 [Petromyzon marinus]|uniref:Uncharacterized protein LOC116953637 isoform X2 n=1 Tax=Petromyzon marinus TaxID=7757 RepID=A0AAJ7XE47_PETMA|nr:uncharacterized protein LOC116953637 isoform X2 [Petromyzon marinus]